MTTFLISHFDPRLEGICGSSARPFATWEGARRALRGSPVKFSRRRPPRPPWPSSSASTDLDVVMQARAEARESGRPLKKRDLHTHFGIRIWTFLAPISHEPNNVARELNALWSSLRQNLLIGFWADGEESKSPLGGRQMVKTLFVFQKSIKVFLSIIFSSFKSFAQVWGRPID